MDSILSEAIILAYIVSFFVIYGKSCNGTDVSLYERKNGFLLQRKSFHNCTTSSETECLAGCENSDICQTVTTVVTERENNIFCQLFDCSFNNVSEQLAESRDAAFYSQPLSERATDRKTVKKLGFSSSGCYSLTLLDDCSKIKVYCDMNTEEGGWIMLQKRFDGSVDFDRNWEDYKNGFGSLNGEFWLGLQYAHQLMKGRKIILRFDLWDGCEYAYMEYYNASISDETDNYRLNWHSTPAGSTVDAMGRSKNQMLTTKDRDNDALFGNNCAKLWSGGWWYSSCFDANLNGLFGSSEYSKGINWKPITTYYRSLTMTEIKFKLQE